MMACMSPSVSGVRRSHAQQPAGPRALVVDDEEPLADLYGPRAGQARAAGLTPPTEAELRERLAEAALICIEQLNSPEKP